VSVDTPIHYILKLW